MKPPAVHHSRSRRLDPGQRWLVWLLLQALLALTIAAGPRAVGGPLHWHGPGSDAHAGAPHSVARHHHEPAIDAVQLDQQAPTVEDVGSGANVAATPWPAPASQQVPLTVREQRVAPPPASTWADADLSRPDHPPRS